MRTALFLAIFAALPVVGSAAPLPDSPRERSLALDFCELNDLAEGCYAVNDLEGFHAAHQAQDRIVDALGPDAPLRIRKYIPEFQAQQLRRSLGAPPRA